MNTLTAMQEQEVVEVLTSLGLSEREQIVYRFVLAQGNSTLTDITGGTKLPYSTVQSIVGRVVDMGMIDVVLKKSKRTYLAEHPKTLQKKLKQQLKEVTEVLPYLESLMNDTNSNAKVRVYYRERMRDIFTEAIHCKEKQIYEIVSGKHIQVILGEKFHFTRQRLGRGVALKSLRVESNEIKKYNKSIHARELREAKFLPRGTSFSSSIFFWDDTIAIFSPKSEGIGVIIESKSIRHMMQEMFDILWEVSRRMETV